MAFILLACIVLSGCAATRFLEEDESFYTGAEIELHPQGKIRDKKQLKKELALLSVFRFIIILILLIIAYYEIALLLKCEG
jgi:hypothetical protein